MQVGLQTAELFHEVVVHPIMTVCIIQLLNGMQQEMQISDPISV